MPSRAFLFDLDGTLVDSLDDIAVALEAALADHQLAPPTRAQVRDWIGAGARTLVARAVTPSLVEPVLARFRVHYAAAPVVHSHVYPGLDAILDELAARGDRLAVVTNKPHELAVAICARLLARWPFAAIVGQRDGIPIKPDPAMALGIARELGIEPARCVVIGDSPSDLETAHAAAMVAVAVTWGFRPRAELVAARPSAIADTPTELAAIFSRTARAR